MFSRQRIAFEAKHTPLLICFRFCEGLRVLHAASSQGRGIAARSSSSSSCCCCPQVLLQRCAAYDADTVRELPAFRTRITA